MEEPALLGETHLEKDGNKDLVVNSSLHPSNNRASRFFKSPKEIGNCLIADLIAKSFLKASNLPKCSGNLLSFKQPLRIRVSRDLKLQMLPGSSLKLLHSAKFKTTSLSKFESPAKFGVFRRYIE